MPKFLGADERNGIVQTITGYPVVMLIQDTALLLHHCGKM